MTHLTYEECAALKEAGFPQRSTLLVYLDPAEIDIRHTCDSITARDGRTCIDRPNTDELLDAITRRFGAAAGPLRTIQLLRQDLPSRWEARWTIPSHEVYSYAETPVAALCTLYLALAKVAQQ